MGKRSACPIATGLDLIGDRWSLLLIRDMLMGKSRFGQFLDSPEGIPTNILSDRLKRLEAAGIIAKAPYQERPRRFGYSLTDMGRGLIPVLQGISAWANDFVAGTWVPPRSFMELRP